MFGVICENRLSYVHLVYIIYNVDYYFTTPIMLYRIHISANTWARIHESVIRRYDRS